VTARTPWIWVAAALVAACACACAGAARRGAQPSLDQYMRYAGPPIQRFSYRNSYTGWQIVEEYKIIMFVGDGAYLLTVVPPCPQMRLAMFMSIRNASGGIVSRFDRVQLDENDCLIDEIRPIDYRRMRQENPGQSATIRAPSQGGH
jgi:Family of unknown function (DUF6491)